MLFNELHIKLDSTIGKLARTQAQNDLRDFLYLNVKPLVEYYSNLYSHEFIKKFHCYKWDGMKYVSDRERDLLELNPDTIALDAGCESQLENYGLSSITLKMNRYFGFKFIDEGTLLTMLTAEAYSEAISLFPKSWSQ